MIFQIKSYLTRKKAAPRSIGSVARFLRETSAAEQKKVFLSAIDSSTKRQQATIHKAEAKK
jgi:ribosomal 50S subunit-associated protein YjgA (DUF615 family)